MKNTFYFSRTKIRWQQLKRTFFSALSKAKVIKATSIETGRAVGKGQLIRPRRI